MNSEKEMVEKAADRYGEFYTNATEANSLLNNFIKTIDLDHFIFASFISHIRKHSTLALFSIVRLHHTQSMMDLRQILESGACAAYAIANIKVEDFANVDDEGILDPSDKLTKKRYKWLEKNYKSGSDAIRNKKSIINNSSAHANIVYAYKTFKFDTSKFETPFFDIEDDYHVKGDLWMLASIIIGLMDLFYGIHCDHGGFVFSDDFVDRLRILRAENEKLRLEMMQHKRYKTAQKKAETTQS